jgi:diadenosine tetraphosphate (Ap4A) HIT family hydrolase
MIRDMRCAFCDQIAGHEAGDELAGLLELEPYRRVVLLENGHATVMPSIGPLAVGHVLICPRKHRRSVAECSPDELEGLIDLAASVESWLRESNTRNVVAFEHGSPAEGSRVACSIEHAHQHVLPWAEPIDLLRAATDTWQQIDIRELQEATQGREYLRVRAGDQWFVAFPGPSGFPSQYLRKLLADSARMPDWDWRASPMRERVEETIELFAGAPQSAAAAQLVS